MKLSDKLTALRKAADYSQEKEAELLGVSRQAVSKWELGDSVPDLDKLIAISQLYNITCDQLLNEEETELNISPMRRLGNAEMEDYLRLSKAKAPKFALGCALCVLSPIPLFVMIATNLKNENMALFGLIGLILVVTVGVALILTSQAPLSKYEWMENEPVNITYSQRKAVAVWEEQNAASKWLMPAGICLCILSCIPLFVGAAFGEKTTVFGLCGLLVFVSVGVYCILMSQLVKGPVDVLLHRGDYSPENMAFKKKYGWFAPCWWLVTVAIYLTMSFLTNKWEITWVIFPPSALIFAAIQFILLERVKKERAV